VSAEPLLIVLETEATEVEDDGDPCGPRTCTSQSGGIQGAEEDVVRLTGNTSIERCNEESVILHARRTQMMYASRGHRLTAPSGAALQLSAQQSNSKDERWNEEHR
jgi:hypothetical protein